MTLTSTVSSLFDDDQLQPESKDDQSVNVWLVGQQASPTQRRGRYTKESFQHPAKMLPELANKIVRTYSKEGDLVVDPMSGIGTTGVEAAWLNRHYVGIEVEEHFAALQERNLALAAEQGASGTNLRVIVGDARDCHGLGNASLVMFSPPYQDAIHNQGDELARIRRKIENGTASAALKRRFENWQPENENAQAGTRSAGYSVNGQNLGHLHGFRYWDAMTEIYAKCFEALKPGGYLVVVTKDQRDRKSGELTNLYGDTVTACKKVGLSLHQHVAAVLCRIDMNSGDITLRTSHWQRMAIPRAAEKGNINLIGQFEDVAVFRRPV